MTALDERQIFAVTPAGTAEITSGGTGLSHGELRVLMLVDGQRDVQALSAVVRSGEIDSLVASLETKGLISRCGRSAARDAATKLRQEGRERAMLALAKRVSTEVMEREFGAGGHVWAARIEDAADREVLRHVLRDGVDALSLRAGETAVQRALEALKPLLSARG